MGTYGLGEIAELCRVDPSGSIGHHRDRSGAPGALRVRGRVLEAKSEIVADCRRRSTGDRRPARLSALAERLTRRSPGGPMLVEGPGRGRVVVREGGTTGAIRVSVAGRVVARESTSGRGSRISLAQSVWLSHSGIRSPTPWPAAERVSETQHRLESTTGIGGSDPARRHLQLEPGGCCRCSIGPRESSARVPVRVVVTPGMVELGRLQQKENAGSPVGRRGGDRSGGRWTDQSSGTARGGAKVASLSVVKSATREAAVSWVRANVGPGDVVLFENDLPDHYP